MKESVSCTECKRLNEKITLLKKEIETLQQICENEQYIDAMATTIALNMNTNRQTQTFLYRATNVEPPVTDMADTLPWNATGLDVEAPSTYSDAIRGSGFTAETTQALLNDASHCHHTGDKPKTSTPARTKFDIVRHRRKPGRKSNNSAPTLTPPLELELRE